MSNNATSAIGLDRHRAGRCLDYRQVDPDTIAQALIEELSRSVDYMAVANDGAARAATLLADLI